MYIVVIGWLYVAFMMGATEAIAGRWLSGLITFVFYGVLPLALFVYIFGRRKPRQQPVTPAEPPATPESPSDR